MLSSVLRERVSPYTKTSEARLASLVDCLRTLDEERVPGDFVECGVWRGGSVILARIVSPDRFCWLYDTFTGMTEPGPLDTKRDGTPAKDLLLAKPNKRMSAASLEEVVQNLKDTETYDARKLRFVKGPVEETLRIPINRPLRIAMLRLDTDWYSSTKIELETLWPLLAPRGFLIIDDYGHWMGANKASNEYLAPKGYGFKMIDYTAALVRKRA